MLDEIRKLDDGWPESAEEQVTLVLLELVHKRTIVNVVDSDSIDEQTRDEVMNRKELIEKGDNRDDMLEMKRI